MAAARPGSRHPGRAARPARARTTPPRRPASVTDARRHWITRYLNARFLPPPRTRSRCSSASNTTAASPDDCTHVHGERTSPRATRRSPRVSCELSDAVARWWVLDDDHRARRREADIWASTGHVAAVHGDELYDILPQTRGGYGRLQDFGIRFGYERVVSTSSPRSNRTAYSANTARTLLLLDHEPLPWARWGEEFTAAMPDEIRQLQERAANADVRPPPGSDPRTHQRDHAALPTQPLPANPTPTATIRRVTRHQHRR